MTTEYFDPFPSYGENAERAQDVGSGDMVVVYEASLSSAGKVIALLKKEGFDAVALDQPDPVVTHRVFLAVSVRIAVPRDQVPFAQSLLRKWDESCSQSVTGLTNRLKTYALYSCVITAIVALGFLVFGYLSGEMIPLLLAVWVTAFALLSNTERIFRYFKKDSS